MLYKMMRAEADLKDPVEHLNTESIKQRMDLSLYKEKCPKRRIRDRVRVEYETVDALNRELKSLGIGVTAVCPFWTKTEFFERAIAKDTDAVVKNYVAMYTAEDQVKRAWRDLKRGKDLSKFGFVARFQMVLAKLLPHSFVMSYWMNQQSLNERL